MIDSLDVLAPAKVNLALRILDREASGYHQLESLFLALDFGDSLRVSRGDDGVSLSVLGPDVGPVESNLAYRAALGFLELARLRGGVELRLEKRIPPRSGLGGGSSDAAATLRALQAMHPGRVTSADLTELAGELGADVPFFLSSSPLALAWRRGDRLLPLPPLPSAPVVLAFPPFGVETSRAFGWLDRHRECHPAPTASLILERDPFTDWESVASFAKNDFEPVVLEAHPTLERLLTAMRETRPELALLSGSGSATFAVYADESGAAASAAALKEEFTDTTFHLTRTLEAFPSVGQR
jgi:4-diphosphocytidyl-2-C-methyl-D-erythritol kinase